MANILMTRVDNRLVHGQVGMTWVSSLGANLVLVANDEVSTDDVQQSLMEMVLPESVESRFFTIDYTIEIIENASDDQLIFIVVRNLQDALKLVENGVDIKEINIGNLHYSEGKTKITPQISITEEDRKSIIKLSELGVELNTKQVPTATSINIVQKIKEV